MIDNSINIVKAPDTNNYYGSPEIQMAQELIMRGVDSSQIFFERNGYNTYSQAHELAEMFDELSLDTLSLRLITTPEHMYRSVRVFKKMGFSDVGGTPAFEKGLVEKNLKKDKREGRVSLNFRYNVWSYMQYEITVVREYLAITYYKLRGWI